MKKKSAFLLMMMGALLAGCTVASEQEHKADRTQSPAVNARWLTLIVKAGNGVTPQPVTLQYESEQCKESRSYGVGGQSQSGTTMMRALNFEKIDLVREPESDAYKARFAIDAGGSCGWKLVSLETSFKYTSGHALVHGQELLSHRTTFTFRSSKNAVTTPNVRVSRIWFPVIAVDDDLAKNTLHLRARSLFIPPDLNPSASGSLILEFKVAEDMAMLVRPDPQNRGRVLVTYPDGATGTESSIGYVGVDDERMICLLAEKKRDCEAIKLRER
ncbi:hypothetical protein G7047_21755 [Diaphorobacter sp. HDW4A]|uniref:hypothetical protein n=1 Tax=Diaphorobacter sp. HDW4A TaxID=2714924 RepID=UPI00140C1E1D|nr:hypothetical protein [Diaphorobacter sp. HDW4A]QIL82265.1 hypothetical protein G7047_21755 [Diaphorobacter sp. HDW4A]